MGLEHALYTYFLRIYAAESKKTRSRFGWSAFAEAVFQTVLIVVMPLQGLSAACIVLFHYHWVIEYRQAITLGVAALPLLLAYLVVRAIVARHRNPVSDAANFGTARDRNLVNLQFWIVLVGSLALPWAAAGIVRVSH